MSTRPKAVSTVFCDFRFRCGQINYRTNNLSSEIHDLTNATDRAAVLVRHIRENAANTGTMNFKKCQPTFHSGNERKSWQDTSDIGTGLYIKLRNIFLPRFTGSLFLRGSRRLFTVVLFFFGTVRLGNDDGMRKSG